MPAYGLRRARLTRSVLFRISPVRAGSTPSDRDAMLAAAMSMRNSELKGALNELCVNSRGVFEKQELAKLLVDKRLATNCTQTQHSGLCVEMVDVPSSNVPNARPFIGFDISMGGGGSRVRCMLDTAASTNLIAPRAVTRLSLPKTPFNQCVFYSMLFLSFLVCDISVSLSLHLFRTSGHHMTSNHRSHPSIDIILTLLITLQVRQRTGRPGTNSQRKNGHEGHDLHRLLFLYR